MSKTTNKGNIGHYKYEGPHSSSNEGFTIIINPPKDSKHMISYKLSSQPKNVRPIISETQATIDITYQGINVTSKEGVKAQI